jgi:putative FmdB family regulatory protein
MPIYEYRCNSCAHVFDVFHTTMRKARQSITMSPVPCPECGFPSAIRIVSGSIGIAFKGRGFHVNDYPSGR